MASNIYKYLIPSVGKGLETGFQTGTRQQEEDKRFQQQNFLRKQSLDDQDKRQQLQFNQQKELKKQTDDEYYNRLDAQEEKTARLTDQRLQEAADLKKQVATQQQSHLNNVIKGFIEQPSEDGKTTKKIPIKDKETYANEMVAAGYKLPEIEKSWSVYGMPSGTKNNSKVFSQDNKKNTYRSGVQTWNPEKKKFDTHSWGPERKVNNGTDIDLGIAQHVTGLGTEIQKLNKQINSGTFDAASVKTLTDRKIAAEQEVINTVKNFQSPEFKAFNDYIFNNRDKSVKKDKNGNLDQDLYMKKLIQAYQNKGFDVGGKHYNFTEADVRMGLGHMIGTYDYDGTAALKKFYKMNDLNDQVDDSEGDSGEEN